MKLLVTGGAGFIGSNFVRRCLEGSYGEVPAITVLDKLTYAGNLGNLADCINHPSLKFIKGDICDVEILQSCLPNHDAVIHFAAESHVDRSISGASVFMQTNALGTQILLDQVLKSKVKVFIHVSTDEVYGSIAEGSAVETSALNPSSPYSASKTASDLIALAYFKTYGLDVRITRCSNNYGPYQFPEKVIPLFTTNLLEGKSLPVYGDGLNSRDWLHVDDHCRAIWLVLQNGGAGEIYNIAGGAELNNLDLLHQIAAVLEIPNPAIDYVEDRAAHDKRYSLNYSKIAEKLGYEPAIGFSLGLHQTVKWYQDNSAWWKPLKR